MNNVDRAIEELQDMAFHPSMKWSLSAETISVAIAELEEHKKVERIPQCGYHAAEKYAGITLCSECRYHAVEKSTGIHWCRMSLGLDGELKPGDGCSRGKAVDDGQTDPDDEGAFGGISRPEP